MCPLVKNEMVTAQRVGLQGWKDGELKTIEFIDNGKDYVGAFGLTFIYGVKVDGLESSLWVRPNSPLAIGLQPIVNEKGSLRGLTLEISKVTGVKQKDTRYNCRVV